jgi:hypothetical protein
LYCRGAVESSVGDDTPELRRLGRKDDATKTVFRGLRDSTEKVGPRSSQNFCRSLQNWQSAGIRRDLDNDRAMGS